MFALVWVGWWVGRLWFGSCKFDTRQTLGWIGLVNFRLRSLRTKSKALTVELVSPKFGFVLCKPGLHCSLPDQRVNGCMI